MHLFAVYHVDGRGEKVLDSITETFGSDDIQVLSDDLLIIRSLEPDPRSLQEAVGIGTGAHPGIVFKLNASHGGYYLPEFWAWLEAAQGA